METNKRKALGRGLEQLFSNESLYVNTLDDVVESVEHANRDDVVMLNVSELRSNPYQPRQTFDQEKLIELANSIKEHGVIEPIVVNKSIKGYEIVAGERRKKACELVGIEKIPAIIKDFTDNEMMEIALLENIQRENLTSIEEAEAFSNLIKALNITQEELAKRIGKSRVYVTNMLGLLRLPSEVKNDILNGFITLGHAKVLSKLESESKILSLSDKIKKNHLSVRDLESLVSESSFKRVNEIKNVKKDNPYNYVEDVMSDKIGNKVRIKNNKIVIPFDSEKDLERVLEILNIEVKVD